MYHAMAGSRQNYFANDTYCNLSDDEVKQLVSQYRNGLTSYASEEQRQLSREASGHLIASQSAWILSVVGDYNLPHNVDRDDVYSEVILQFLQSLNKSYDPDLSNLTTYTSLIIRKRLPRIIETLSRGDCTGTDLMDEVLSPSPYRDPIEDQEMIELLGSLMQASLNDLEAYVYNLWICDMPLGKIAQRANEFVAKHNPDAPRYDMHKIRTLIKRITASLRELIEKNT
jgi:hypothetical protein